MKKIHLFAAVLTLIFSTNASLAGLIASWDLNMQSGSFGSGTDDFTVILGYGPNTPITWDYHHSFGPFTEDDIGTTVEINRINDPFFDVLADKLTNGNNDSVTEEAGAGGSTRSESSLYGASPNSLNGIDFNGYYIEALTFTLTGASLESPGSDPNGDGNWVDYSISGTFSVYGIPEPASIGLLGLVSGGLFFTRRIFLI